MTDREARHDRGLMTRAIRSGSGTPGVPPRPDAVPILPTVDVVAALETAHVAPSAWARSNAAPAARV